MDNSVLKNEIDYWDIYFSSTKKYDKKLFELAFFKIFVKFELFVSEIFVHYCIGNKSVHNYLPNRKLEFIDRNHFESIIRNSNSNNIDFFSKMYELAPHIFEDDNTPFIVFNDPDYNQSIGYMRILRNFIAHESLTSKNKYSKTLLNNKFIEPYEYLLKNKKGTTTSNYTFYVTSLIDISEYLLNPIP